MSFPPEEYDRKIETQKNWRGLFKNGGTCGLIRWSAQNLTSFDQVLHGCRQPVSKMCRIFSRVTGATLNCSCKKELCRFIKWKGMRSSRHGPYKLGNTRVTMFAIKSSEEVIRSKAQKSRPSSDCRLKFAYMKPESLVIVDQHATVNILESCTHRPSRQGSEIGLKWFFPS